MKAWLRQLGLRLVGWGRRLVGLFPLSLTGLLAVALLAFSWLTEVTEHSNQLLFGVVLAFGAILLFLLILNVVATAIVAAITYRDNAQKAIEMVFDAGVAFPTGYRVLNPWFLPILTVRHWIDEPVDFALECRGRGVWYFEEITAKSRGYYTEIRRWIEVSDIFGLTSMQFMLTQKVALKIRPAESAFETLHLRHRASGEGFSHPDGKPVGEMIEMRRYQAGDPLRFILWRIFGKTRKLLVRAPERAIVDSRNLVLCFVSGMKDDASAKLARVMIEDMDTEKEGRMLFIADGTDGPSDETTAAMDDLIHSASCRHMGGRSLSDAVGYTRSNPGSQSYIFVPAKMGPWLHELKRQIGQFGQPPHVIVGVDFEPTILTKRSRLSQIFLAPNTTRLEYEMLMDFKAVYSELESFAHLDVVHADTGVSLDPIHLQAIKAL